MEFEVGDKVRLTPDATRFSDWKRHQGEVGTIIKIFNRGARPYEIRWKNGQTSHAGLDVLEPGIISNWRELIIE